MLEKAKRGILTATVILTVLIIGISDAFANRQTNEISVKVSAASQSSENVPEKIDAPNAENAVTQTLLSRLKRDYKTTNIVIALDEVTTPTIANGKNIYQGSGDVRIGFDWQKIDFSVTIDETTQKVSKVEYDIQN